MKRRLVIASLALVLSWPAAAVLAAGDSEDQERAGAAVAVFNERLIDAGWTSTGPPLESVSAEIIEEANEEGDGRDCFRGYDLLLSNTELRFDGETARAFSDEFALVNLEPGSTDPLPSSSGFTSAVVITVADPAVDFLDDFVALLGASETATCMASPSDSVPASSANGVGELNVTPQSDLGVGEVSARLDSVQSSEAFGEIRGSYLAARTGRSLVFLHLATSGSLRSDVDPVAELTEIVDELG